MREVFVDTSYLIAIYAARDRLREKALQARKQLGLVDLVTTEAVLMEFLTAMAALGAHMRGKAVRVVQEVIDNKTMKVVWQSRELLDAGLELYRQRPDKTYSIQDCISMVVMQDRKITDVLSSDRHFRQEGFNPLMLAK